MLVVRCYSIMDNIAVEVTCSGHGRSAEGSHLLYRTIAVAESFDTSDVLMSMADVLADASHRADRGEFELTDDCVVQPSL